MHMSLMRPGGRRGPQQWRGYAGPILLRGGGPVGSALVDEHGALHLRRAQPGRGELQPGVPVRADDPAD
eukprot:5765655-Alexandrium_andersonii.AAC.1